MGEGDGADSRHMREDRRVEYAATVFSDIRKFSSTPKTTSHPRQGVFFAILKKKALTPPPPPPPPKKERRRNSKWVQKPELEFFEPGGPVWWTMIYTVDFGVSKKRKHPYRRV